MILLMMTLMLIDVVVQEHFDSICLDGDGGLGVM